MLSLLCSVANVRSSQSQCYIMILISFHYNIALSFLNRLQQSSIYQPWKYQSFVRNSVQTAISIVQRIKIWIKYHLMMVFLFWGIYNWTLQIKKKYSYLMVIWLSSLGKCLFRSYVHFSIGLSVFLVLRCMSCLCIFEINHFSVV